MISVGKRLRSAREDRQRSIEEIAEDLCVLPRYLRAIEADELGSLPGVFFYKSFVKQYARALDLDLAQLQSGIDAVCAPELVDVLNASHGAILDSPNAAILVQPSTFRPTPAVREPEPLLKDFNRYMSDRRIGMSAAGLAVVLLLCSGFYAWWTKAPSAGTAPLGSPAAAPAPVSVNLANGVTIPVTAGPGGIQRADLNLSATEPTWVSITSDGKEIFSGVLLPSQPKTVTGVAGARMKIGNAGGLEVRWKGKPIGPFGPRGQVRTVVLTEDNFEIVPQKPEVSEDPAQEQPTL